MKTYRCNQYEAILGFQEGELIVRDIDTGAVARVLLVDDRWQALVWPAMTPLSVEMQAMCHIAVAELKK